MSNYLNTRQGRKGYPYPSPYMDIAGAWFPSAIKDLFRWCKFYFYTNPVVSSIIYKLAEYPVTEFIYELPDETIGVETRKKTKKLIEGTLNLKSFIIEALLDYFTYGNTFISIHTPFKRYLTCPVCGEKYAVEERKYRLKQFKFMINCEKCNSTNVVAGVEDVPVNDPNGINLIRWNPENIQIDYNQITGKSAYFYRIPNKIRNDIIRGKRIVIDETPIRILEALSKRMDLKLDNENLFHFKRPTLAEEDMGWGKPIIMSVMKDIFYLQTLRKGQEAIALQHIVPLDMLFPVANGSVDPYTHVDLGRWKAKVEYELKKWREDPNYVSIMPIPLNNCRIGGDARMLLITPEIESTLKMISAGLGVQLEFIFGGLTYSGSSISLRTLENHFLTTRQMIQRFLDWVVDKLRLHLDLPKKLEIKMVEFKMADDVQQTQLTMNLNQLNKVSDDTLLSQMGMDYEIEYSKLKKQAGRSGELNKILTINQAGAQGEAQKIQSNYQLQIQEEQQKKMEEAARKDKNKIQAQQNTQMAQQPMSGPEQANVQIPVQTTDQGQPNDNMAPMEVDWSMEIAGFAQKAAALPPEQKKEFMNKLKAEMPEVYKAVKDFLQKGAISRGETDMRPLPEQKTPRRKGIL